MPTNPFKQLCLDSIAAHRSTLDNMEHVVNSLPDNWQANSGTTAGGGSGVQTTATKTPIRHRARTRNRAGGGRGSALGSQAQNLR